MQTTIAITSLALLSFFSIAPSVQPVASFSPRVRQEEAEKSPLAKTMGVLKQGQRGLKKAIKDPAANKPEILKILGSMESAALRILTLQPATPEGLAKSESALFQVRFRIQMTGLLHTLLEMEQATLKGDGAMLAERYKALTAGKKGGHREFKED